MNIKWPFCIIMVSISTSAQSEEITSRINRWISMGNRAVKQVERFIPNDPTSVDQTLHNSSRSNSNQQLANTASKQALEKKLSSSQSIRPFGRKTRIAEHTSGPCASNQLSRLDTYRLNRMLSDTDRATYDCSDETIQLIETYQQQHDLPVDGIPTHVLLNRIADQYNHNHYVMAEGSGQIDPIIRKPPQPKYDGVHLNGKQIALLLTNNSAHFRDEGQAARKVQYYSKNEIFEQIGVAGFRHADYNINHDQLCYTKVNYCLFIRENPGDTYIAYDDTGDKFEIFEIEKGDVNDLEHLTKTAGPARPGDGMPHILLTDGNDHPLPGQREATPEEAQQNAKDFGAFMEEEIRHSFEKKPGVDPVEHANEMMHDRDRWREQNAQNARTD